MDNTYSCCSWSSERRFSLPDLAVLTKIPRFSLRKKFLSSLLVFFFFSFRLPSVAVPIDVKFYTGSLLYVCAPYFLVFVLSILVAFASLIRSRV